MSDKEFHKDGAATANKRFATCPCCVLNVSEYCVLPPPSRQLELPTRAPIHVGHHIAVKIESLGSVNDKLLRQVAPISGSHSHTG